METFSDANLEERWSENGSREQDSLYGNEIEGNKERNSGACTNTMYKYDVQIRCTNTMYKYDVQIRCTNTMDIDIMASEESYI